MAYIKNALFDKHVALAAASPKFENVSEHMAKHLTKGHPFSTKRWPHDQADGMLGSGIIVANDGYFMANERALAYQEANGGALAYNGSGDVIALCEWPTMGRIRSIRYMATTAAYDPDDVNNAYFPNNTAAAFPSFTLQAVDPNDASFVAIPLLQNRVFTDSGTDTINFPELSLAAIAYGVNRRKDPLIIQATLGGSVVANSGLVVWCDFVVPRT